MKGKRLAIIKYEDKEKKVKVNCSFEYYPNIPNGFAIITDTREQNPYKFGDLKIENVIKKLDYGDYSIVGFEDIVTVERKSMDDFCGSIGKNRKRFGKVIVGMSKYEWKGLLVECTEDELLTPQLSWSSIHPNSVYGAIVAFEAKYDIHVYCNNRDMCRMRLVNWLVKFYNKQRGL